ncbi:MAG: CPBP family intramembrane metalloprotease [Firmicutes bacterium]|nr:CPBP family intramembrane metalloprotease [Bacillota bacterium]
MWEKINKFVYSQTVLSVFLLSAVLISAIAVFGFFIIGMTPAARLAVYGAAQIILSGIVVWLMRKLGVFDADDFRCKGTGKKLLLAWFGVVYIIVSFFISFMQIPTNGFITPNIAYLIVVILQSFVGTALFEELLFRGLVLKLLLRKMGRAKKGIICACVISSVFFGLSHISNIFAGAPVLSTVSQIICAMGVGLFCAAIFVRTGKLWIPILFHGLLDLSAQIFNAIAVVSPDTVSQNTFNPAAANIISFILLTLFTTLPVLIAALILLRKVEPDGVLERV